MGTSTDNSHVTQEERESFLSRVKYRMAKPTDIFRCYELEKASYPPEEASSKNDLQYRQHHAAPFFRCAILDEDDDTDEDTIIGFVCSTRSEPEDDDSASPFHQSDQPSLIVQSVVVDEEYRRLGLGTDMMLNYIDTLQETNAYAEHPVSKLVLFAKVKLLVFYLHVGFSVLRPTRSTNGKGDVYRLELQLQDSWVPTKSRQTGGIDCYIVDSFATAPGTGNKAGVVTLSNDTQPEAMAKWMQTVARELNLSETAFTWPRTISQSTPIEEVHWEIRYYTPDSESPVSEHATLAAAAVLYQTREKKTGHRIVFHTSDDEFHYPLERAEPPSEESLRTRLRMDLPSRPPRELETADDKMAIRMILESTFSCKIDPLFVGTSEKGDILIELKREGFDEIDDKKLNFKALEEWDGFYRGVIVCCVYDQTSGGEDSKSKGIGASPDFLYRFFDPKDGGRDPKTGSALRVLGPFFAEKLGKEDVMGMQLSDRGCVVECQMLDDKVRLTGTAITTMAGTLWMKKEDTLLVQRVERHRSESLSE